MSFKSSFLHGPQLHLCEGGSIPICVIRMWPREPTTLPSPPQQLEHRYGPLTCSYLRHLPPSETVFGTL